MFTAKIDTLNRWPRIAVSATARVMAISASKIGRLGGHHGAEDDQQDDERDRQADALALAQVGGRLVAEVGVDAGGAGDQRLKAAPAVGAIDDGVHLVDVLARLDDVAGHDDRDDGRVAVRPRSSRPGCRLGRGSPRCRRCPAPGRRSCSAGRAPPRETPGSWRLSSASSPPRPRSPSRHAHALRQQVGADLATAGCRGNWPAWSARPTAGRR